MVLKRPFGDGEGGGFRVSNQQAKRRITSSKFAQNVISGLSSQDLAATLEPFLRSLVRDEVHRSCQRYFCKLPRSTVNVIEHCNKTSLQLRFLAKLPTTFFTGSQIKSKDNTAVKLVLFDVDSNTIVSSGPFSSLKVEIVPLDGDFSADDEGDWAKKDFDNKVICARHGRRPLITGDLVVTLENGVADLGELCFTDNSSWRRSRKFMIGARITNSSSTRDRIREAKTQAFVVKDQRGESYQKHHPPALEDEIWRLEKIAKDGVLHERLAKHRICTVKDFLQMCVTNQSLLRELLGKSSKKTWETIIKHAKECVLDDKMYIYPCGADGTGLLLDSVLTVVGATFNGQNLPLDKLSMFQMPLVEDLKLQAYKSLNEMVPIDASSFFGVSMPTSNLHHDHFKTASLGVNIPILHQDDVEMPMYGLDESSSDMELGVIPNSCSTDYFSTGLRNSFITAKTDFFQVGTPLWPENDLFMDPSNQSVDIFSSDFGICFSSNGSPRARWCKIRAALKWGSVRRNVAAKRTASFHGFSN
ncbi:calmodulin-binding protein 60 B-like [Rutidosis leptorrhynchoides]|uniref:calmodulin-binding protein 60 B-like n=1 Tax=Rutidosis leptorrhynchoides TaxID=125765 RepID=UPI003A98E1B4